MKNSLTDMDVVLAISDPWELGNAQGWEPHDATIVGSGNEGSFKAVVIRLKRPFEYKGVHCEYFVASARHVGESVESLASGKSVFCGLTRISPERLEAENPCDLSWWRGGIALIGQLSPMSVN